MNELIENTLLGLWVLLLVLPIVLGILSTIAQNIWLRNKVEVSISYTLQKLLFKRFNDYIFKNDKGILWDSCVIRDGKNWVTGCSWVYYNFVGGGILLLIPYLLIINDIFTPVVKVLLSVAAFLWIPMVLIDIYLAIRYNIKTGKVETIEDLKKRIEQLESENTK